MTSLIVGIILYIFPSCCVFSFAG